MKLIRDAQNIFTLPGRQCICVGTLENLSRAQTDNLFSVLSRIKLSRVPGRKSNSASDNQYILRDLYYITGGHPRTMDSLITKISKLKTTSTLQFCITQFFNDEPEGIHSPSWEVMQALLLAKEVNPVDIIPDSKGKSFDVAISNGEMIGSLRREGDAYCPNVPEMFLHKWAFTNKLSTNVVYSEIALQLLDILNVRFNSRDVFLEDIFLGREYILSRLYSSPSLRDVYGNISLKDMYHYGQLNESDTSNLNIKVDATKPLICLPTEESIPSSINNIIYKPTKKSHPGYDFRIRFSLAEKVAKDRGEFLDVYYQVKFSEEDASTSLGSDKLRNSHAICTALEAHPKSVGFVVVFMTWRKGFDYLKIPPNSLLLHKKTLKRTLGPNFSNFVETLTEHPISLNP